MPVGGQGSAPSEPESHSAASPVALVPALAVLIHVSLLSWDTDVPSTPFASSGARALRAVLEIVWIWLPWAAVCAWGVFPGSRGAVRPGHPRGGRLGLRAAALGAFAISLHYFLAFRSPYLAGDWNAGRLRAELAAFLSSTWAGAPWPALGYAVGWTATASLLGRVALDVAAGLAPRIPRARGIALGLVPLIFVIGSGVVLRYATGSAWPLP